MAEVEYAQALQAASVVHTAPGKKVVRCDGRAPERAQKKRGRLQPVARPGSANGRLQAAPADADATCEEGEPSPVGVVAPAGPPASAASGSPPKATRFETTDAVIAWATSLKTHEHTQLGEDYTCPVCNHRDKDLRRMRGSVCPGFPLIAERRRPQMRMVAYVRAGKSSRSVHF